MIMVELSTELAGVFSGSRSLPTPTSRCRRPYKQTASPTPRAAAAKIHTQIQKRIEVNLADVATAGGSISRGGRTQMRGWVVGRGATTNVEKRRSTGARASARRPRARASRVLLHFDRESFLVVSLLVEPSIFARGVANS